MGEHSQQRWDAQTSTSARATTWHASRGSAPHSQHSLYVESSHRNVLDEKPGAVGDGLLREVSRFRFRDAVESPDEVRTLSLRLDAVSTGTLSKIDISAMSLDSAQY